MGCFQSLPDDIADTNTSPLPPTSYGAAATTTTTPTTGTGTGTTTTTNTARSTTGTPTATTATATAATTGTITTPPSQPASAAPTVTTTTKTTEATNDNMTPPQRTPARNIFAKPINQVVTTAHQQVQQLTDQVGNLVVSPIQNMFSNNKLHSKLPFYEKSPTVLTFLRNVLSSHFVFESCTTLELQQLCDAMEPLTVDNGTTIITQGDPTGDYCYIIHTGSVDFLVDGKSVGTAATGQLFGELSLLYSAPRAATVVANTNNNNESSMQLYRLDQITFRTILQQQTLTLSDEYMTLLKKVKFLRDLDDYHLYKLSSVLEQHTYTKDTVIVKKGDTDATVCYILLEGTVTCSEISVHDGSCTYADIVLNQPGDYFGERAIMTGEPRAATVTATSSTVTCYTIDKTTFETVLGDYESIIVKANEERLLSSIPLICDSKLPAPVLKSMTQLVKERTFTVGTTICQPNEICEPALYIIRTGHVTITKSSENAATTTTTIGPGGYFGDDQLMFDITKKQQKLPNGAPFRPTYSVVATAEHHGSAATTTPVTVGILTLASLRTIMDTQYMGQPAPFTAHKDSLMYDQNIVLSKLQRHTILGAGTFGMVYLVSRTNSIGEQVAYALKVQSKYELIKEGQASAVICEKNIMAKLQHPFLIGLINSYHDETFVYILLQLIQGGELYSYIHTKTHDYLSESSARFYAACIGEGLGYMHKQGYIYRDLKPENVLVDHTGYCVIIDFGFAKYVPVPTKTFTLCGTPLYIAPEVILNRGHASGADHWSFGILIYEMLFGTNPFYKHGMDQMDLFRGIVKARYVKPTTPDPVSDEAHAIMKELLTRDPNQRLGSLAAGEDGILYHPWFSSYGMDMDELRAKKYTAPVVPVIKDPLDSSNFENWDHLDDKTKKKYPPVAADDQWMFADF